MASVLVAGASQATELKFQMGGKDITPNTTVTFNEVETDFGEYLMDPKLFIVSDIDASNVSITADCTTGQKIQLCAGGECERGTKVSKTGVSMKANTPLNMLFECMGYYDTEDEIPTNVTTEFTAQYAYNDSSIVKFILVMNSKEGSVSLISVDNNLYVENGAIVYNVEEASTLALYNLGGEKVLEAVVSGEGSLSTSALQPGVYAYTLGNKSGKLYVK